jgi:hypothetical protein
MNDPASYWLIALTVLVVILVIITCVVIVWRRRRLAEPKTVYVTYPALGGSRDFMDDALVGCTTSRGRWECDGGGTLFGPEGVILCCSDVTIQPPRRENLESLLEFLRNLDRPYEIVVRAQGKLITIPKPQTSVL